VVINPYTFLPLGVPVERDVPAGHERLAPGRFSGSFSVTLTARSPLLVGPLVAGGSMPPRLDPRDPQSPVMLPGSSLAGAVRSVHEALNNSCLRVVDLGYRAVNRHMVSPKILSDVESGDLKMAVVTQVTDEGLPSLVELCDEVVWVPTGQFAFTPTTGDRVAMPDPPLLERRTNRPPRLKSSVPGLARDPHSRWVVLVTDVAARDPDRTFLFACAHLQSPVVQVGVPRDAQAALARAVETSTDLRTALAGVNAAQHVAVEKHGATVGYRLQLVHDGNRMTPIPQGTPVWVRTATVRGQLAVTEVRLSLVWRGTSRTTLGERIPTAHRPCQDPTSLCPSCRVFGSAGSDEPDPEEFGPSRQNSYRGHVRFADAVAVGTPHLHEMTRAPLSSPKPTAGQFYLDNTGFENQHDPHIPLAHWDSNSDRTEDGTLAARRVRGRKFYWRTQPGNNRTPPGNHRSRIFGQRNDAQAQAVTILGVGSKLRTRITFDNLSADEIGSLVAAVDPRMVLGHSGEVRGPVISVGGGRPFGWGAVTADITGFYASTAKQRYLGADAEQSTDGQPAMPLTMDICVAAYRGVAAARNTAEWALLTKLLTVNPEGVQDAHVWYPPNPTGRHQRGSAKYDEGFAFWQRTSGFRLTNQPNRPLQSLPNPAAPDQNIPRV